MSNVGADQLAEYRSGSTEPATADVLAALVKALRPSILIETGTFEAKTTTKLLDAMFSYGHEKRSHLISLEYDRDRAQKACETIENTPMPIFADPSPITWEVACGDALQFLRNFEGSPDFVFLDDDHTATHVHQELAACFRIMRPGGVICMHDVIGPFGLDRVCRDFGVVVLPFQRLHVAGGLGVVVRP